MSPHPRLKKAGDRLDVAGQWAVAVVAWTVAAGLGVVAFFYALDQVGRWLQ